MPCHGMPYDDTYLGCNACLTITSSILVLASTAGNLEGQIMHQVGEMTRGGELGERDGRSLPAGPLHSSENTENTCYFANSELVSGVP